MDMNLKSSSDGSPNNAVSIEEDDFELLSDLLSDESSSKQVENIYLPCAIFVCNNTNNDHCTCCVNQNEDMETIQNVFSLPPPVINPTISTSGDYQNVSPHGQVIV